jgi:hypothetical protein
MNTFFIPSKLKVGYQNRKDTYSKKLAYVIYFDEKGVLRKETSFAGWIDKTLGTDEFENVPTEGFVLNKTVGGYKSDFNYRSSYIRVYDPRGFEIEIELDNLLYILEHYSSIKGKGISGEFVYAWHGPKLVLLPVESEDYRTSKLSSDTIKMGKAVAAKSLVAGHTYAKRGGTELVYLMRLDTYHPFKMDNYKNHTLQKRENKEFFFLFRGKNLRDGGSWQRWCQIKSFRTVPKSLICVDNEISPDYAKMVDRLYESYFTIIDPVLKPDNIEYRELQDVGVFKKICNQMIFDYSGYMSSSLNRFFGKSLESNYLDFKELYERSNSGNYENVKLNIVSKKNIEGRLSSLYTFSITNNDSNEIDRFSIKFGRNQGGYNNEIQDLNEISDCVKFPIYEKVYTTKSGRKVGLKNVI